MVDPQSTPPPPGVDSPLLGDNRGDGLERDGGNPSHISEVGSPVVLGPPGWGDPPVLPGAESRPFPIGGVENVSKVFSHICM